MKNIFTLAAIGFSLFSISCTKPVIEGANNVSLLELSYPATLNYNTPTSGLNYFSKAAYELSSNASDTFTLQAIIQNPLTTDVQVSLAVDNDALTAYNNDTANHIQYAIFPTANYSVVTPTATIPAGQTSTVLKIAVNPQLFDISKTGYMLPVTISTTGSIGVAQNLKTVYFHIEKDPTPPYDRTGWKVTGVSDERGLDEEQQGWAPYPDGYAVAVLDGDPSTYWHSIWDISQHPERTAVPGFPHWISFDMLTAHTLHGIYFMERQNSSMDKAKGVIISKSNDGTTWTDIASFNLQAVNSWQKIPITPVDGVRYFKVTFTSNFSGALWTNMAEIKPY